MNKKRLLLPMVAIAALMLTSCDTKLCYCYENGHEEEMYVSSDVACGAYSSGNRGCVEQNERMDPREIASDQKKAKAQE